MRNAEVIVSIAAKLAAAISEATGKDIPALTLNQITQDPTPGCNWHMPSLPYTKAVQDPAAQKALSSDEEDAFFAGEESNFLDVLSAFDLYVSLSMYPEDPDIAAEEDAALRRIPARFLPDSSDGRQRTTDQRVQAEDELAVAYTEPGEMAKPDDRRLAELFVREVGSRFTPEGFTPKSTDPAAVEIERGLAGWAVLKNRRDELVVAALNAGVTKTRVQQLTGISRSTINRLLEKQVTIGVRVAVPDYSVPEDWAREGEVVEIPGETVVVELDDGHRQELPKGEVTPIP